MLSPGWMQQAQLLIYLSAPYNIVNKELANLHLIVCFLLWILLRKLEVAVPQVIPILKIQFEPSNE